MWAPILVRTQFSDAGPVSGAADFGAAALPAARPGDSFGSVAAGFAAGFVPADGPGSMTGAAFFAAVGRAPPVAVFFADCLPVAFAGCLAALAGCLAEALLGCFVARAGCASGCSVVADCLAARVAVLDRCLLVGRRVAD